MSGLVIGLQNRVRQFESARYLKKLRNCFFIKCFGVFLYGEFPLIPLLKIE